MGKFQNVMFQVNGGPWLSIFGAVTPQLPDLDLYNLVKKGVTFGALDYYDDEGNYSNIKFRVYEGEPNA